MKRVTVLGGGSWGTTLALVLHDNGHQVVTWEFDPKQVEAVTNDGENILEIGHIDGFVVKHVAEVLEPRDFAAGGGLQLAGALFEDLAIDIETYLPQGSEFVAGAVHYRLGGEGGYGLLHAVDHGSEDQGREG